MKLLAELAKDSADRSVAPSLAADRRPAWPTQSGRTRRDRALTSARNALEAHDLLKLPSRRSAKCIQETELIPSPRTARELLLRARSRRQKLKHDKRERPTAYIACRSTEHEAPEVVAALRSSARRGRTWPAKDDPPTQPSALRHGKISAPVSLQTAGRSSTVLRTAPRSEAARSYARARTSPCSKVANHRDRGLLPRLSRPEGPWSLVTQLEGHLINRNFRRDGARAPHT